MNELQKWCDKNGWQIMDWRGKISVGYWDWEELDCWNKVVISKELIRTIELGYTRYPIISESYFVDGRRVVDVATTYYIWIDLSSGKIGQEYSCDRYRRSECLNDFEVPYGLKAVLLRHRQALRDAARLEKERVFSKKSPNGLPVLMAMLVAPKIENKVRWVADE